MSIVQRLPFLLAAAIVIGTVAASTVTLTGTCTQQANRNILNFSLANNGNGTAYNVAVTPVEQGVAGALLPINAISPGHASNISALVANPGNGTFVYYFSVLYDQGASAFYAVFPCFVSFGNAQRGNVSLAYSYSYGNNTYSINVSAYNNGISSISDNISLILPNSFSYVSGESSIVNIPPNGTAYASFRVRDSAPGSYSGAIASDYRYNGTNRANMLDIVLEPVLAEGSSLPTGQLFELFAVVIVAFLLVLIARAVSRKSIMKMRERVKGNS